MNRIDLLRAQWDRTLAVVLSVAGGVTLLVGYVRISGTPYPAEQLPVILSAGVGALFLLGVGATLWLSADLRDEWVKLDELAVLDEQLLAGLEAFTAAPQAVLNGAGTLSGARVADDGRLGSAPEPKQRRTRR